MAKRRRAYVSRDRLEGDVDRVRVVHTSKGVDPEQSQPREERAHEMLTPKATAMPPAVGIIAFADVGGITPYMITLGGLAHNR
jgi:hypothetical protein